MKRVVLDADVFIDYLKGKSEDFILLVNEAGERGYSFFVPTAVLVEIFVGYEFLELDKFERAGKLLEDFECVALTEEIALKAGRIGRENKLGFLGTVDLAVAATAIAIGAEVATHNVKHFKLIPGIKIFDFEVLN